MQNSSKSIVPGARCIVSQANNTTASSAQQREPTQRQHVISETTLSGHTHAGKPICVRVCARAIDVCLCVCVAACMCVCDCLCLRVCASTCLADVKALEHGLELDRRLAS
eukprot:922216-Rhodomonas_salina.1